MRLAFGSNALPTMVAVLVLGGCAHQDPPANGPGDMPVPILGDAGDAAALTMSPQSGAAAAPIFDPTLTASNGQPAADRETASETANSLPAGPAIDLTDAQILEVTHVADRGEIDQARLGQSKARDTRVKKFAAMMLKDHTEADGESAALAAKAGLTPTASPTSASLEANVTDEGTTLSAEAGPDFDKAYVDAQVREHQAVLEVIEQKLLPNAKNADLKLLLAQLQAKAAMHLEQARALQDRLDVKARSGSAAGM